MPLRSDFFYTILATFVTDLTPVACLLAGAASAALAMQPVAQTLGELAAASLCPPNG